MGEMFEHAAVLRQQPVEHALAVVCVPAPEDVVLRAGDDLDRVELDEAEPLDRAEQIQLARRRRRKTLSVQPERAGSAVVDPEGSSGRHGADE